MRLPLLLAWTTLLAAPCAFASWSAPAQVASVTTTLGCGSDAGHAIHRIVAGGKEYLLKSSSPLGPSTLAMAGRSVAMGAPVTVFTLAAQTASSFLHVQADGTCGSGAAVEVLGLSMKAADPPVSISSTPKRAASAFRVTGNRVEFDLPGDLMVSDLTGRRIDLVSTSSGSRRSADLSPLPSGVYLLRIGRNSTLVHRL